MLSVGVEDGTVSSGVTCITPARARRRRPAPVKQSISPHSRAARLLSYQVDSEKLATVADTELTAPANGDLYFDLTGLVEFNNSSGTAVAQLDVDGKRYESEISHVVPSATVGCKY